MGAAVDFLRLLKLVNSEWCAPNAGYGVFQYAGSVCGYRAGGCYVRGELDGEAERVGGYGDVMIDLEKIMRIVRDSGYRGYLPIETLGQKGQPKDPFVMVPAYLKKLRAAIAGVPATEPAHG